MITLRPATDTDLPLLVRLRDDAARWMIRQGIQQWRPGDFGEEHFRRVREYGEVWVAEAGAADAGGVGAAVAEDRPRPVIGAFELWWEDEDAWGVQPPVAGYVHRLMVDREVATPGAGRLLLGAAERRVAETGRELVRLDCLATNERLNAYYENAGYRAVGHKSGKPQAGGPPRSFTLREKSLTAKSPTDESVHE
ncbi:GNAT family N-acetyltransferase [Streptomyces sp. NPDC051940]|uniref:GNAT family N-acetyltransferase n=1 Tax=Streptomyces sp. NPDC051940 TaxID=3155675 RepID=UPI00341862C9